MRGNKHSFWQALVIALIIFWTGILVGVFFEHARVQKASNFYFDSETEIFDFELISDIVSESNLSCSEINYKSIEFADKIYQGCMKLEKYDNSNKITGEIISLHRRYDLLRTMLWKEIIQNKKRCPDEINTIVYLYQYKDPTINLRATQSTISNYLTDIKKEYGDNVILIPIAADTDIGSLNILRDIYGLDSIPTVFVNEELKIDNLNNLNKIESSLNLGNN